MKKYKYFMLWVTALVVVSGCVLTLQQQKLIAKNSGTAAVMLWVGIDSPTAADMAVIKTVVAEMQKIACTNNEVSYTERVYPLLSIYIGNTVKPEHRQMAGLAALSLLKGIDIMFAMNPTWLATMATASALVESFCDGAVVGLGMSPSDPVMLAARQQQQIRVKLLQR